MKNYEVMMILESSIPETEVEKAVKVFEDEITSNGGEILTREIQGKRSLAYKIKGSPDGIYAVLNFKVPSEGVKKLERKLKLSPQVLRCLVVKKAEGVVLPVVEKIEGSEPLSPPISTGPSL